MTKRLLLLSLLIAHGVTWSSLLAAEPIEVERILLPTFPRQEPGRFGSLWTSELVVTNSSGESAVFAPGSPYCLVPGCDRGLALVPPGVTIFQGRGNPLGGIGGVWVVEKKYLESFQFFLRVWDESREAEDWGTAVPVVREEELLAGPVVLTGAPAGRDFRVTLRVYEPIPTNSASIRVVVVPLDENGNALARENELSLILPLRDGTPPEIEPDWPHVPSSAEIGDLVSMFPELVDSDLISVRIEPLQESLRFWAMLSVTHNETQRATIIAPE